MTKELLSKIATSKEQMRAILDKAKAETRNLSESEQREFEALELQARMADMELRAYNPNPTPQSEAKSVAKRFAEGVTEAVSGGRSLQMRAIQDEPSVHDASVPVLYQDLQKPFEQGLILSQMGCRVLYNVHGEPLWPFVTGIEASWQQENSAVGESNLTFTVEKSTPKRIATHINVSRRAINQSNLDLYGLVMNELSMSVARTCNRTFCDGQTHGPIDSPFKESTMQTENVIQRKHASNVTLEDIIALEHTVLNVLTDNVESPVFVMNWKMVEKLRATPYMQGQLPMLLQMVGDKHYMLGRQVFVSNYVPDGLIYFGDFRYMGLVQYGDVNVIVDPYSGATTNTVKFTLNTEMDMLKIRKEAFAISKPKS